MVKKGLHFLTLWLSITSVIGQNSSEINFRKRLSLANHDTARCRIYVDFIETETDIQTWVKWNTELKALIDKNLKQEKLTPTEKNIFLKAKARTIYNDGYHLQQEGESTTAIKLFDAAGKLATQLNDLTTLAHALNNTGMVYANMADFPKAIENYNKALAIRQKINDPSTISYTLNNLGMVYRAQGDFDNAMSYFKKALIIQNQLNDLQGLAATYNNTGLIHYSTGKIDSSIYEFNNALLRYEKLGNKQGVATCLINMGMIKGLSGSPKEGLIYLERAVAILDSIHDRKSMVSAKLSIASMFAKNKDIPNAIKHSQSALTLAQTVGFPEEIRNAAKYLYTFYKMQGNDRAAMENYELFIVMRDSINNEEGKKASIKSQLKYEYEKKAAADSVKVAEEKKVTAAQLKQEKTQRYALYGGLGLVGIFALFMVNRFQVTNRQKKLIESQKKIVEEQKHIVEEKQKEILDSIYYARRIQRALVTSDYYIERELKKLKT